MRPRKELPRQKDQPEQDTTTPEAKGGASVEALPLDLLKPLLDDETSHQKGLAGSRNGANTWGNTDFISDFGGLKKKSSQVADTLP